ncbi:MAG: response regulator [Wenzhouxiangellaceae bacterium]|nr:response regulator [Wenzhouxiangellaceae bacterium]
MAKILAVDDSRSLRRMVSFTLNQAGHEISEAENGREALAIAAEIPFDLVLMDVNMPELDGLETVKQLRRMPSYQSTPVLMLTTEASEEKKNEGRAAGASGWMVKPFSPEKLVSVVDRVLQRQS